MIFLLPLGLLLLGFFIFGIVQSVGKSRRDKKAAEIEKVEKIRKTMRRKYGLNDTQVDEIISLSPGLAKFEETSQGGNGEMIVGFVAIFLLGGGLVALGVFGGNWLPLVLIGVPTCIYLICHIKVFHNLLEWCMVLAVILFFVTAWFIGRGMWSRSALPW